MTLIQVLEFGLTQALPLVLPALVGGLVAGVVGAIAGLGPPAVLSLLLVPSLALSPPMTFGLLAGGLCGVSVMRWAEPHAASSSRDTTRFGASLVGALAGTLVFAAAGQPLAEFGQKLGPADLAGLMMAALTIGILMSAAPVVAIVAVASGLLAGIIGTHIVTGVPRLAFGQSWLLDGVSIIPVAIGLFALADALRAADGETAVTQGAEPEAIAPLAAVGRGALLPLGIAILLPLGVPAGGALALLTAGLVIHGFVPGPDVLIQQPALVAGLVVSLLIGFPAAATISVLASGIGAAPATRRMLAPVVIALGAALAYAVDRQIESLALVGAAALFGRFVLRGGFERGLCLTAFVIAPTLEVHVGRMLLLTRGDLGVALAQPIMQALVGIVFVAGIVRVMQRKSGVRRSPDLE